MKLIFAGTPEFAVQSLLALGDARHEERAIAPCPALALLVRT